MPWYGLSSKHAFELEELKELNESKGLKRLKELKETPSRFPLRLTFFSRGLLGLGTLNRKRVSLAFPQPASVAA